jgi:hypothetical protein
MMGRDSRMQDQQAGAIDSATSASDQAAAAQRVLDTHVTSSATGRCLVCGSLGPCWRRENAVVIFSRTLRLPHRRPGASRPELVNARQIRVSTFPLAS